MLVEPFVEYEFDLSGTFSFGAIGSVDLDHCFSSGRICSVLLEYDVVERFENLTKNNCGQGAGADVMYMDTDGKEKKVQCKSLRLLKPTRCGMRPKKLSEEAGRTTMSGLFDTAREVAFNKKGEPKKSHWKTWDEKHNSYFAEYDYFMYKVLDEFVPTYKMLMFPTCALLNHSDIERQASDFYYGKRRTKKIDEGCPFPKWSYPMYVSPKMYSSWVNHQVKING